MSSETSTERVRPKPDQSTLEPWQFFVLAGLGCATAALFASRGQGVTAVVLLTILMGATALVGLAVLRTLRPLVTAEEDRTSMFGQRTRVALEREKMLALLSIKELSSSIGRWASCRILSWSRDVGASACAARRA